MSPDPRVTPTGDLAPDNPAMGRLTIHRLGMEVATELGIDPHGIAAFGLNQDPTLRQLEAGTHSPKSRKNP